MFLSAVKKGAAMVEFDVHRCKTVELIEHVGASWHLWNGGFGLGNAQVRTWMYPLWKQTGGKSLR